MLSLTTCAHFRWELMLYCLHCPTLNKGFLALLFHVVNISCNIIFQQHFFSYREQTLDELFSFKTMATSTDMDKLDKCECDLVLDPCCLVHGHLHPLSSVVFTQVKQEENIAFQNMDGGLDNNHQTILPQNESMRSYPPAVESSVISATSTDNMGSNGDGFIVRPNAKLGVVVDHIKQEETDSPDLIGNQCPNMTQSVETTEDGCELVGDQGGWNELFLDYVEAIQLPMNTDGNIATTADRKEETESVNSTNIGIKSVIKRENAVEAMHNTDNANGLLHGENSDKQVEINARGKPYYCSICLKRYWHPMTLKNHAVSHVKIKSGYLCPYCKREFSSLRLFESHLQIIKNSVNVACPLCHKHLQWSCEWMYHSCIGQENSPFNDVRDGMIPVQGAVCANKPYMDSESAVVSHTHMGCGYEQSRVKDNGTGLFINPDDAVQPVENTDADFAPGEEVEQKQESVSGTDVTERENLAKLIHITSDINGFISSESRDKQMEINTRLRAGRKLFKGGAAGIYVGTVDFENNDTTQCYICYKVCASVHSLRNHLRRHTGEKPYMCAQCPQRYRSTASLRYHENIQHPNDIHRCPYCKKQFRFIRDLKKHKKAMWTFPHPCSFCHKLFKRKCKWRNHVCFWHDNVASDTLGALKQTQDTTLGMKTVGGIEESPELLGDILRENEQPIGLLEDIGDESKQPVEFEEVIEGDNEQPAVLLEGIGGQSEQNAHFDPQYPPATQVSARDNGIEMDMASAILSVSNDGILQQVADRKEGFQLVNGTDVGIKSITEFGGADELIHNTAYIDENTPDEDPQWAVETHVRVLRTKDRPWRYATNFVEEISSNGDRVRCHVCSKSLLNRYSLQVHLQQHYGDKRYQCSICHKSYTYATALKSHIASHGRIGYNYQCPFCKKHFVSQQQKARFLKHLENVENFAKLCRMCQRWFQWICEYENHVCIGQKNNTVDCFMTAYSSVEGANKPSGDTGDVQAIFNDTSGEMNQIDASVNGMGPTMDNLVSVKPIRFGGDDVETDLGPSFEVIGDMVAPLMNYGAGVEGDDIGLFTNPVQEVHSVENTDGPCAVAEESVNATPDTLYQCSICHKAYVCRVALISHIALHAKIECGYQCPFCKKHFGKVRFRKHLKIDPPLTKFVCWLCQKRFQWRCEWDNHECSGQETNTENDFMKEYSIDESVLSTNKPSGDFRDAISNDASGEINQVDGSVNGMKPNMDNLVSAKPIRISKDDSDLDLETSDDIGDMVAPFKNSECGTWPTGVGGSGDAPFTNSVKVVQPMEPTDGHCAQTKGSANGTTDKPYQCSICPKAYVCRVALISHIASHAKIESGYQCPLCKKHFKPGKLWFRKHLKIDLNLTKFVCGLCQKRFQWRCEWENHACSGHENDVDNGSIMKGYSIFESVVSTDKTSMDFADVPAMHDDTSGEIKKIDGSVNGMGPNMDYLVSVKPIGFSGHGVEAGLGSSSVHIGDMDAPLKNFECEIDQIGVEGNGIGLFTNPIAVVEHTDGPGSLAERSPNDTANKPYYCSICHNTYTCRVALISHIALHAKIESGYQCPLCEKHFGNLRFRKHLKIDLTLSKFVCCLCQNRFHWKCEWETHACSGQENDSDNGFMSGYSRIESVVDTNKPSGDIRHVQAMSNDVSGDSVNDSVDGIGSTMDDSLSVKPNRFSEDDAEPGLDSSSVDLEDIVAPLKNFGSGTGQIGVESRGIKLFPNTLEVVHPVEQYAEHHALSEGSSNGTIDKPYQCSICHKTYVCRVGLISHIASHAKTESGHQCPFCKKYFKPGKLRFKKHLQFDLNLTKFVCWLCQKRFQWRCAWEKHACGQKNVVDNGFITGYSIVESVLSTKKPSGDFGDVRAMSNDDSGEINQVDGSVNGITPTMDLVSVKPTGFSGDDVKPSLDWSSEDIRLIVAPL